MWPSSNGIVDAAAGEGRQAGHRVGREALLALLAVRHDGGAGRLEAPERVGDGVVVQGVELLGRDRPGGGRLHAVDERLGSGDAADGFGGECHGGMLVDRSRAAGSQVRATVVPHTGADSPHDTTGEVHMARDEERLERSQEEPIVGGLPDVPGILTALRLTPELGVHLRGLADELLVNDFAGRHDQPRRAGDARDRRLRGERLLLLHGLARGVRDRAARDERRRRSCVPLVDVIKLGSSEGSTPRCRRCSTSRGPCGGEPRDLTADGRRRRRTPPARPTPTSSSRS